MSRARVAEPCVRPDSWLMRAYAWWVGVDRSKSALAVLDRHHVPILACVGANGGGKTMAAVYTVLPTLRGVLWECDNPDHLHTHGRDCAARRLLSSEPRTVCDCSTSWEVEGDDSSTPGRQRCTTLADGGTRTGFRRVLSTVALRDPDRPSVESAHYEPLRSFVQLIGVEHADVLLDEVTGVASARSHQSLPVQVENLIVQLRRRDARLIWTTPDYGAADVRIRQVTQGVVYCRGFARERGTDGRVWSAARMFRWMLWDASDFDAFTSGARDRLRPISTQWFWRPGHVAQAAYDTYGAVAQLGAATDGGMCMTCGGSRSRAKCTCHADPERLPPGVVEVMAPSGSRSRRFDPEVLSAQQLGADVQGRQLDPGEPDPMAARTGDGCPTDLDTSGVSCQTGH